MDKVKTHAPKEIFFILPDLETGGAERIVLTLANHLPREKFKPIIVLMRKEGGYLPLVNPDVEIIDLGVQRIRQSLFPILKLLWKRKPNIVFTGYGEVNAYLALFIKLFPKIKFIARETNVVSEHVKRKEILFFYRFYNNYHRIICQSDDMQRDLIENFSIKKDKTVKINNPVDIDFIQQKMKEEGKPAAFVEDRKHIVAIGNLSHRKGFDLLLRVFEHLREFPIHLHILGDGRDRENLEKQKLNTNLEKVTFHGRQANPYRFLHHADAFVLSSRYEGFPNVLLEAGACGTYSLANTCPGGIDEIIIPELNGEMMDITQTEQFADTLKSIIYREKTPQLIQETIVSRFSLPIILEKYIDVFEKFN